MSKPSKLNPVVMSPIHREHHLSLCMYSVHQSRHTLQLSVPLLLLHETTFSPCHEGILNEHLFSSPHRSLGQAAASYAELPHFARP